MTGKDSTRGRTASCACGNLTVSANGEPLDIYACSCRDCQRETGSAFSYLAVFPETAVSITGERRAWRRQGDSGRWIETEFCPSCGATVFGRMEVWPEVVTVSAGCFADPDFAKPKKVYWAARRHRWLSFPDETEIFDSQPG